METKNLIIRRAKIEDKNDLYEMLNSEFILRYNAMTPASSMIATEIVTKDADNPNAFYLESKKDHHLIGVVSFEEDSLRYLVNSLCLSYYMNEKYTGKGYMHEALVAIITHMFSTTEIELISARSFIANTPSQNVLIKLGFTKEGCLRQAVKGYKDIVYDDLLFSLLKKEWQAQL